ncbi:hypothetical protein [Pantoea sp. 9140]|uniref:hypothetical protein n=1 Tax=Pantoea sp. 9140 TaxID=1500896 RepID=UPI0005354DDF|nr:hypothetical protein [Pantoea sp. 9140]
MGHAQKKAERLYIPPRDKRAIAGPRASIGDDSTHHDQVRNAFGFGFARYEKAMDDLSKV